MGFFAEFDVWLTGILSRYIADNTAAIARILEPAIVTLGVFYVVVWGYQQLMGKIAAYPGLATISSDYFANTPNLDIDIKRAQAKTYGVSEARILSLLRNAYSQNYLYLIKKPDDQYQVILEVADEARSGPEDLSLLYIKSDDGKNLVPLKELVTWKATLGPIEERFARRFPGAIARFTDGERVLIVRQVTRPTRQLHPADDCFRAIGYTVECDLHLYMKRVWALEPAWGETAWHRDRVAASVIGAPGTHRAPDPDRRTGRGAAIGTRQRTGPDLRRRREHGPDQHTALGEPDIDAELRNLPRVVLGPARRGERARELVGRAEDEPDAAGRVACQRADLNAALRVGRRRERHRQRHDDSGAQAERDRAAAELGQFLGQLRWQVAEGPTLECFLETPQQ